MGNNTEIMLPILVFAPIAAAFISYIIGRFNKTLRDHFVSVIVVAQAIAFVLILANFSLGNTQVIRFSWEGFCQLGLNFEIDGFRALYGSIAAFMWAMTGLFSEEYFAHYRNRNRYYMFLLLTLGATIGVFLSADLYTTFIFFEMMSFTSYVWVAHEESSESLRAAQTYLAVAVIGGLVMLMGLFLLYTMTGTLAIDEIHEAVAALPADKQGLVYASGACMLFGFGAKAGMFPLQIWLPKAHPVAPAPASALLSGILTKAGVYGILIICGRIFLGDGVWGSLILTLGVITMFVGALLAVFSVNLKRTLACSSVSQIGFILVGIGMSCLLGEENHLAVRGALLHMVNHSLIKLVLFMAAGVVFMNIHQLDLNSIRGFGKGKRFLQAVFLIGALGIGGIPLFNGYVSKTLIHESIVEYIELLEHQETVAIWFGTAMMKSIEWIFLISGGMTVAYMTKLYVALFVEENNDKLIQAKYAEKNKSYINLKSMIALSLSAVLLPIMGILPGIVMDKAADLGQTIMIMEGECEKIAYFSLGNLKGALISIVIGLVIYFGIIRTALMEKGKEGRYLDLWPKWLDLENLIYRPVLVTLLPLFFGIICRVLDSLVDWAVVLLRKTIYKDSPLPHETEDGIITRIFGDEVQENIFIVSRSMSFGLMLFCIGLIVTVAYLLLR